MERGIRPTPGMKCERGILAVFFKMTDICKQGSESAPLGQNYISKGAAL